MNLRNLCNLRIKKDAKVQAAYKTRLLVWFDLLITRPHLPFKIRYD